MQIELNGKRNITLDFDAPKKFKLFKDGVEIPYIRTGKNSIRVGRGIEGVAEVEEIVEKPKIVKPMQLQPQQMALVNPNDVIAINQAAQQLEIEQGLLAETQKQVGLKQDYLDIQQQRINEAVSLVQNLETNNAERISATESGLFNLAGEIANVENNAAEGINTALNELEVHKKANNPHKITKNTIGLDKVDNTSDMDKPVSKAVQKALDEKADKTDIQAIREEIGEYQEKNEKISNALSTYTGGLASMSDHRELEGRDFPDQHPIGAITGLQNALDDKVNKTAEASKVYGTDESGQQTTYNLSQLGGVSDVRVDGESVVTDNVANLGSMALGDADDYSTTAQADLRYAAISYEGTIDNHIENKNNPHEVTKDQVGLGNADNTSDLDKPISTATQTALNGKVNTTDLGNAELDIQKNGTSVGKFTANASTDKVINLVIPTQASDINALPDSTKYGASLSLNINSSTYVVTAQLKDQNGDNLGSAQTIDLPLESVVVNGSYDSVNKKIILTLENGNTIDIPVGDLVAGLQSEITENNKLSADLVDDTTTTNKFVTSSDISTWNAKQDMLVSGTNIKTVNNNSLLGSGNINIDSLPSQTGQSGKFLTTDGSSASWGTVDALPSQSGQSGKFLTTNGTTASWDSVPSSLFIAIYNSTSFSDIVTAYNAGKQVICSYSGIIYYLRYVSASEAIFFSVNRTGLYMAYVNSSNVWSDENTDIPTKTSDLNNDSGYITGITSSDVTTALGYTPYDSSNPSGYTSNVGTVTSVNNTSPDANGNVTLSIPAAQVNSDWNAMSGVAQILNKPSLATVATTGAYSDLSGTPTVDQTYDGTSTNAQSGTAVAGAISGKADTDLSNLTSQGQNIANWSSNVTNCITEIPQDIKLELNNGTLTLKAGSKVYVPNGFESDGVTPKFDVVTVESDFTRSTYGYTVQTLLLVTPSNTGIIDLYTEQCHSGTVAPTAASYMFWYDTVNNLVKLTTDGGSTWTSGYSLPVGLVTSTTTTYSSIDHVFNGFGYIGSTVFALPGVKGLIPDGRNADGSLKNIEVVVNSVMTYTITGWERLDLLLYGNSINVWPSQYSRYTDENFYEVYDVIQSKWVKSSAMVFGFASFNSKITSFTPKTAFHALDYNDSSTISGWSMPSSRYIDLTLGASGTTYTAPANGWFAAVGDPTNVTGYLAFAQTDTSIGSGTIVVPDTSYTGTRTSICCYKGKSVNLYYGRMNITVLRFYYAEGENV